MAKGGPALRLLSRSTGGKAASRLLSDPADASHQEVADGRADICDVTCALRARHSWPRNFEWLFAEHEVTPTRMFNADDRSSEAAVPDAANAARLIAFALSRW